jgi:hypothetical protein
MSSKRSRLLFHVTVVAVQAHCTARTCPYQSAKHAQMPSRQCRTLGRYSAWRLSSCSVEYAEPPRLAQTRLSRGGQARNIQCLLQRVIAMLLCCLELEHSFADGVLPLLALYKQGRWTRACAFRTINLQLNKRKRVRANSVPPLCRHRHKCASAWLSMFDKPDMLDPVKSHSRAFTRCDQKSSRKVQFSAWVKANSQMHRDGVMAKHSSEWRLQKS